jgi:hypothetical protein
VDRLRWLERWRAEIAAGEPAAQVAAQVLLDILRPREASGRLVLGTVGQRPRRLSSSRV